MPRGKTIGINLVFKPETPRFSSAEEREAFRKAAQERNNKIIADRIKSQEDAIKALRDKQGAAREAGRDREADRYDLQAKKAQKRLDAAKAKQKAREDRQDRLDAYRERKKQDREERKKRREEERERRRRERERIRQERKDKAAERPKGKPTGGHIVAVDNLTGGAVEINTLDPGDSFGGEGGIETGAGDDAVQGGAGNDDWSTFGDHNTANTPVPFPGEPGAPNAEAWAVRTTATLNAVQAVVNGAFGGPQFLDANIAAVSHNRPGKDAVGSRIGTHVTAYPGQTLEVGNELQDAAMAITGTLVATPGSTVRAAGVGVLDVVREHRGTGQISDLRPLILLENGRGVTGIKGDGLNSKGPPLLEDEKRRIRLGAGGEIHTSAVAVDAATGQTGDKLRVGTVDPNTRRAAGTDLAVTEQGELHTHKPQNLVSLEEHPDSSLIAEGDVKVYALNGVAYTLVKDGDPVALSTSGAASGLAVQSWPTGGDGNSPHQICEQRAHTWQGLGSPRLIVEPSTWASFPPSNLGADVRKAVSIGEPSVDPLDALEGQPVLAIDAADDSSGDARWLLVVRVPDGFTQFGAAGIQLATHAGYKGDTTGQEQFVLGVFGPDNLQNAEIDEEADEFTSRTAADDRTDEEAGWTDLQITGEDLNAALPDLAAGDLLGIVYGLTYVVAGAGNSTPDSISNLRIAFA